MSDRRPYRPNHQQFPLRSTFDDRHRSLEDELKRKNHLIDSLKNEVVLSNPVGDLSRSSCMTGEQSILRTSSQRSMMNSNWNVLSKDREIAKLKAIIFEKDNEFLALTSANKASLLQMEERMERERKVWNEHKELLLAGERAKFEEEKTRLLKELQEQVKMEQERCQRLEKKLYDAQMESSEAQLMLKESGRERINAVYGTKEQCRKEFQDEISRLRNQFQLEKENEFTRVQDRVRELEETLDQMTNENADQNVRQHELFLNLETAEKTSVRSINDSIKKLHMAMDSPAHVFATIPHVTSFTYDRDSIIERLPTRSALKVLQDTVDEVRNYILQQRVQIEAKTKFLKKSKVLTDRTTEYSNRYRENDDDEEQNTSNSLRSRNSFSSRTSKQQKENDRYFRNIDRLSQIDNSRNRSHHSFQLSSQQNETIDNLVQKLEDHIATELDRLTKQRLTLNGSTQSDDRSQSFQIEVPRKIKFESISNSNDQEMNQDSYIRHLQGRISDLRDDNSRLRDHQQSKSINQRSAFQDDERSLRNTQ